FGWAASARQHRRSAGEHTRRSRKTNGASCPFRDGAFSDKPANGPTKRYFLVYFILHMRTMPSMSDTVVESLVRRDADGALLVGCDEDSLPRLFGRVLLLMRLAGGGMGEVYLGASGGIEGAERPCVVKTI